MFCRNCGKEIDSSSIVCPHCGFQFFTTCVIHFKWDNMKGNTYLKTTVAVDGHEIGVMKCSDIIDTDVQPGMHRIDLFFRKKCVVSEEVEIHAGQTDEYFAFRQTLTGLKRVNAGSVNWVNKKNLGAANIPRCPTCGSTNIKRISMSRKVVSAGFLGIASGSVLKTFECKNCKYRW